MELLEDEKTQAGGCGVIWRTGWVERMEKQCVEATVKKKSTHDPNLFPRTSPELPRNNRNLPNQNTSRSPPTTCLQPARNPFRAFPTRKPKEWYPDCGPASRVVSSISMGLSTKLDACPIGFSNFVSRLQLPFFREHFKRG